MWSEEGSDVAGKKNAESSSLESTRKQSDSGTTEQMHGGSFSEQTAFKTRPLPLNGRFIPVVPRQDELGMVKSSQATSSVPLLRPRASRKYSDCDDESNSSMQQERIEEVITTKEIIPSLALLDTPSENIEEEFCTIRQEEDLEGTAVVTPQSPPPFPFREGTPIKPLRLQMKIKPAPDSTSLSESDQQPVHPIPQPPDETFLSPRIDGDGSNTVFYKTPTDNVSECVVEDIPSFRGDERINR